jgi:hypothetical protein
MAVGEPGLPREFLWRDKRVVIDSVLRSWRTTKQCHHGSGEKYVRKHWYEVKTSDNAIMRIYFDRQPESGRKGIGWWLFSVCEKEDEYVSGSDD